MKLIGYIIFALIYYLCKLFPIKSKQVFCVMTHDSSEDSNVGTMINYLKQLNRGYTFYCMKKEDRSSIELFLRKPYQLARSEYILQDNIFLPLAFICISKKVKVIQLWHGTGTIKKFGQSVNKGLLKTLEKRANNTITHLIVNSNDTKEIYQQAFDIPLEKIFVYGLPRTDHFFSLIQKANGKLDKANLINKVFINESNILRKYPQLIGKRLIVYAPTFRDEQLQHPKIQLELEQMYQYLETEKDTILVLKLHPHVSTAFSFTKQQEKYKESIYNMSQEDTTELLVLADLLITDYSSIIFEYCLLERPILFFAYDFQVFSNYGRGFYKCYQTYVPGPIAKTTKEVIQLLQQNQFPLDRVSKLKNQSYKYMDGKSAKRIAVHVFSET